MTLDYCGQLWSPYMKGHIKSLETIQKSFTRQTKRDEGTDLLGEAETTWNLLPTKRTGQVLCYLCVEDPGEPDG